MMIIISPKIYLPTSPISIKCAYAAQSNTNYIKK